MISKDKKYRTRDGREVRIYATDGGGQYPIHGAILFNGQWSQHKCMSDGRWTVGQESCYDLVEVKTRIKREYWVNVYPESIGVGYEEKREADIIQRNDKLACVKIVIDCEEGEGL